MNCYFVKATIDNGRAAPHTHIFHMITDEEWSEKNVYAWAQEKAEAIIDRVHSQYGAEYSIDIITPSPEQIERLISSKEHDLERLHDEISALTGLLE